MEFVALIMIGILLFLSAYFAASEIAFTLIDEKRLKKAMSDENAKVAKTAKVAYTIRQNYAHLISTILTGNNIFSVAVSSLATVVAISYFGSQKGPLIASIAAAMAILIFGEILPKTIIASYHYRFCLATAKIMRFFQILLAPIVLGFNKLVSLISPLWRKKKKNATVDEEVLEQMVDEIEEEGFIDEQTGDLLRSAIDFTTATAHEIMKPRVDVFGFDIEDDISELINNPNIFKYSRIPIYRENLDNIVGILNTKLIIHALLKKQEIVLDEILNKPIYVHKTKTISSLLRDFKATKTHIAIVVDEFGGTMGIVTLEDILEELVGDIWDEGDDVEEEYQTSEDGVYIIDGDMNIYDLFELVDFDDRDFESEYETVGGWCTEILEKFPAVGDTFAYHNLTITILEVKGFRVERVKVEVSSITLDEDDE